MILAIIFALVLLLILLITFLLLPLALIRVLFLSRVCPLARRRRPPLNRS